MTERAGRLQQRRLRAQSVGRRQHQPHRAGAGQESEDASQSP